MIGTPMPREDLLAGLAEIFERRPDLRGLMILPEILHGGAVSAA